MWRPVDVKALFEAFEAALAKMEPGVDVAGVGLVARVFARVVYRPREFREAVAFGVAGPASLRAALQAAARYVGHWAPSAWAVELTLIKWPPSFVGSLGEAVEAVVPGFHAAYMPMLNAVAPPSKIVERLEEGRDLRSALCPLPNCTMETTVQLHEAFAAFKIYKGSKAGLVVERRMWLNKAAKPYIERAARLGLPLTGNT